MPIYVVLKKKQINTIYLPSFEAHLQSPAIEENQKMISLEAGEYVDVATFDMSEDASYIQVQQYRVSNLDDQLHQKLTEQYSLPRFGK